MCTVNINYYVQYTGTVPLAHGLAYHTGVATVPAQYIVA